MKKFVFVIVGSKNKKLTYSSIRFSYYGNINNISIIESADFKDGFIQAKNAGFSHAIMAHAGTIFSDVNDFLQILNNYPNKGLIGHIVDPKDPAKYYYLDKQCLFLDLSKFESSDFDNDENILSLVPVRSEKDIHDDYTPLWINGSDENGMFKPGPFSKLISKNINKKELVVNFNQKLRSTKRFLYTDTDVSEYINSQKEYLTLAESQLWLFNNEQYNIYNVNKNLICPGSGLYWIFHLINTPVESIEIVDISKNQVEFAKELYTTWDGKNYGQFAFDFIAKHQLKHFNLNNPKLDIDKLEQLKLKKRSYFIEKVNEIFASELEYYKIFNFQEKWNHRFKVDVSFNNQDILTFKSLKNKSDIWMSNILNYKYAYIKHYDKDIALNNEYHTKN